MENGTELCFPQLFNNSCKKPTPPQSDPMFVYVLLSSISLLTSALNLLVIISISHFRQLHSPTNLLILSLAVSDLLVGLLLMPVEIFFTEACWFLGELMCALYYAQAVRPHITGVTLQRSVRLTAKKSEMKAARTLGVVIVVFLICFCPYYSPSLVGQDIEDSSSSTPFVVWLLNFNSCLNPIIYAFFYPWFRKSIKVIVTLKILQPDSSDTKIL
ncbi:trace amine-associated receptor 13c-like [Seriola lalandi dorsalis]|uniref:trace amine-associated receptor 13c-like n=1 Tax=Seriola lalandi dorsalis TaxID=1841481 RepID=UPI000C6FA13E|nr:trace amine-associated receptor 13c-like [Seriola lalandi dorsalis]